MGTLELPLPRRQHLTFSKALPSFSKTVPPSAIRDVISFDSINKQKSQSNPSSSIPTTNVARGFGSDSFNNNRNSGRNNNDRASPIVLVPTTYANNSDERIDSFGGRGVEGSRGFRDLEDFYADDVVEERVEEDSDESESESEGTESDSDSSRSESGSEDEGSNSEEDIAGSSNLS